MSFAMLRGVRPYLVVGDAGAAIDFCGRAFEATELERHMTPNGRVAHAKLQLGEHPDAAGRAGERLPRVGLRLYVADVDTPARWPRARPARLRRTARSRTSAARPSMTRSASRGGSPRSSRDASV